MEDMKEGIAFAHAHGVKVYVTANILAHNQDLAGVRAYFAELKEIGPDALIISDPGVPHRHGGLPGNRAAYQYSGKQYKLWNVSVLVRAGRKARCDGKRAVLEEIREIRGHIPDEMEIETFIHGAMCISYSGKMPAVQLFYRKRCQPGVPAPIRAGGNMRSWKSPVRESTCRYMKTREELTSLTQGSLHD